MKMQLKKNDISYTLTNIMPIDENINESKKNDVNIHKSEKIRIPQSIPLQYLLSAYHHMPL